MRLACHWFELKEVDGYTHMWVYVQQVIKVILRWFLPENHLKFEDIKEYVASLIGLYKNNGAVLHVGNFSLIIQPLYTAQTQLVLVRFA